MKARACAAVALLLLFTAGCSQPMEPNKSNGKENTSARSENTDYGGSSPEEVTDAMRALFDSKGKDHTICKMAADERYLTITKSDTDLEHCERKIRDFYQNAKDDLDYRGDEHAEIQISSQHSTDKYSMFDEYQKDHLDRFSLIRFSKGDDLDIFMNVSKIRDRWYAESFSVEGEPITATPTVLENIYEDDMTSDGKRATICRYLVDVESKKRVTDSAHINECDKYIKDKSSNRNSFPSMKISDGFAEISGLGPSEKLVEITEIDNELFLSESDLK